LSNHHINDNHMDPNRETRELPFEMIGKIIQSLMPSVRNKNFTFAEEQINFIRFTKSFQFLNKTFFSHFKKYIDQILSFDKISYTTDARIIFQNYCSHISAMKGSYEKNTDGALLIIIPRKLLDTFVEILPKNEERERRFLSTDIQIEKNVIEERCCLDTKDCAVVMIKTNYFSPSKKDSKNATFDNQLWSKDIQHSLTEEKMIDIFIFILHHRIRFEVNHQRSINRKDSYFSKIYFEYSSVFMNIQKFTKELVSLYDDDMREGYSRMSYNYTMKLSSNTNEIPDYLELETELKSDLDPSKVFFMYDLEFGSKKWDLCFFKNNSIHRIREGYSTTDIEMIFLRGVNNKGEWIMTSDCPILCCKDGRVFTKECYDSVAF